MKRPPGSKHSVHYLTPSLKKVARSIGRRNCRSIACQVVNHKRVRQFIVGRIGRLIRKDMECICSYQVSSMLRKRTPDAMKSFSWGDLTKELEEVSPIFYTILKECVQKKKRTTSKKPRTSYAVDNSSVIGMCAAILLRHRNKNMCLVQRIVSALLYSGHAPKQVHTI